MPTMNDWIRCVSVVLLWFLCSTTVTPTDASTIDIKGCEEVFVGAGWAGVYAFYRRVLDDPSRGPKACLFEESWRIGGRTYSVSINHTTTPNFVQDIGAYRFSPDMHLPGDLILHELDFNTECYAEDCPSAQEEISGSDWEAPLRRIVDPTTKLPIGYVAPLKKMINVVKSFGARVFLQTPLVKVITVENFDRGDTLSLEFLDAAKDRAVIHSPAVLVLNLPRHKLFEIDGIEASLEPDTVKTLKCIVHDYPSDFHSDPSRDRMAEMQFVTTLEKAYLYYSDAWWRTVLHKPEGYWPNEFPAVRSRNDNGLLFNIRFHDGPVYCEGQEKCHGLLEIYYDASNETVYSSTTRPDSEDPLGILWNTDGPASVEKLNRIHIGLMEMLSSLFLEKSINDPKSSIEPPLGLIVGVWNQPTADEPLGFGYTAPTKVTYEGNMSGLPDIACGVPGLTDATYRDTVLHPWGRVYQDTAIFLVNNDWVCQSVRKYQGDWAEESLLQAERAMYLLGLEKPSWLDSTYYDNKVVSSVQGDFGGYKVPATALGLKYCWYAYIAALGLVLTFISRWYRRNLLVKRLEYTAI